MNNERLRRLAGLPEATSVKFPRQVSELEGKLSSALLAEAAGNSYYEVVAPLTVWVAAGFKPSNHYYGAARIHKQTWRKMELQPDDELHWIPGGLFAVSVEGVGKEEKRVGRFARLSEPTESSNFAYDGSQYDPRRQKLKELIKAGKIEKLDEKPEGHTKYLTDI